MRTLTVTSKTEQQIAAEFAAVFKDIQPAGAPTRPTQHERLAPYRKQILKQRRRGLTWKQIATAMRQPPINEQVTEKLLRAIFGAPRPATPTVPAPPSLPAPANAPAPQPPAALPPRPTP